MIFLLFHIQDNLSAVVSWYLVSVKLVVGYTGITELSRT